jgi:ribonucleotide reductase beta subunit family protein with ferritin-like domain
MSIRLLEPKTTYTIDYPEAVEFANKQAEIFWLPDEIHVEKDLHDLKTNFTEAEYHGVISTLKLFTLYELQVGNEYWQNYVGQVFQRPDIQRMDHSIIKSTRFLGWILTSSIIVILMMKY